MTFEARAFAALTQAKKQFGEYAYHDKGAHEVMEVDSLVSEIKRMGPQKAGASLSALEKMKDTYELVSSIILSLDEWDGFDALLDQYPNLAEYY